jgi:adenylate cyclase class IV
LHKNVRINIDRVQKLGNYVELETRIDGENNRSRSLRSLDSTKAVLRLAEPNAIGLSYIDLLAARKQ